jgi:predicted metal-dependent hydrolase
MRFFSSLRSPEPAQSRTARSTHQVGERSMALTIVRSARAKRLTLRIEPGGRGLKVTVPPSVAQRDIDAFLSRQEGWLLSKLPLIPVETALRVGHKVPIGGVAHAIVHEFGRGTTHLRSGDTGPEIVVHGDTGSAARRVADYLKKRAKQDIPPLVARHAAAADRKAGTIRFKDTSSRWGSCSSQGNLNFSWRIMMAPPAVINYLVAHEVAHLVHMDHSPQFWAQCEALCPDMDRCKRWLKRNGPKLQAIGFEP